MPVIIANDCGIDSTALGIWDKMWSQHDYRPADGQEAWADAMAAAGNIFVIHTNSDCGYNVHIHVDEPVSLKALENYTTDNKDYGFLCASGRCIVGGVEDFGTSRRELTSERDEFDLEPGFYAARIHAKEHDESEYFRALESLPAREQAVYRWNNNLTPIGCSMVPLVCIIALSQAWSLAVSAVASLMVYFVVLNLVFRRLGISAIEAKIHELQASEPDVYIELRTVPGQIPGGAVRIQ